jgi:flavodoxin
VAETNKKAIVAYFSHGGNTREVATLIQKAAGCDIFEIERLDPYPKDDNGVVLQAKEELESGSKPAIRGGPEDIAAYDLVFVGFPNWCDTFPAPVKTFLSKNDLAGKTVAPFCTHGGGGIGQGAADVARLCPKAKVLEALVIRRADVKTAEARILDWVKKVKN